MFDFLTSYGWVLLFPVLFVLWGCVVLHLIAWLSGWKRLARTFGIEKAAPGLSWRSGSGRVGLASYNNCLQVAARPDGCCLRVMPLFALGHQTLFLPFAEIRELDAGRFLWISSRRLIFRAPGLPKIRLYGRLCDAVEGWESAESA
ncbi:MAG: hypothetical protein ACQKBY_04560 [Verrucomicrobiales bacterium]